MGKSAASRRRGDATTTTPAPESEKEMDEREASAAAASVGGTPEREKPKLKKRKKNKDQQSPSAVSDAGAAVVDAYVADKSGNGCTNGEDAPGDADVSMSTRNVGRNSAEDSVERKKRDKDNSRNCGSLQGSSVERKKIRRRERRRRRNNNTNRTSGVQSSSLQPGAGEAGLAVTADENNTPDSERKKSKKKRKRNLAGVTEAPSVERKDVGGTGSIGKMDGEVQPGLSEEEANKLTKIMGSSICESEEFTANNVSLKLVQGIKLDAKAKADCLRSSTDPGITFTGPSTLRQAHKEKVWHIYSPRGSLIRFRRKKLLILDLNGLLADINQDHHNAHMSDAKVRGKLVFKRPYYDDFLRFCFQNFELGIWSSRMKANVDSVVNILMKDLKQYLLFCWDLSKCTVTGCKTLENKHKPLVLKELKKLWNKEEPGLPWEQGEFSPSNTLLVDDSPYKAVRNPPHTAIFPHPYSYCNKKDDSLGPGGDLRVYLENLAAADDVQCYVREHPFGQPSITESDPHWNFYAQILDNLEKSLA